MTAPGFTLAGLLEGVEGAQVRGDDRASIAEVRDDSRKVGPGDLFVAVPGTAVDGRRFLADAVKQGAAALVIEGEPPAGLGFAGPVVVVPSARRALGVIARNRFRDATALQLSAVTGTNGKTTTTYIVEAMLSAGGLQPGIVGTVSYRGPGVAGGARPAPNSTPGALLLHELFDEMHAGGATDVVLEATSHALEQGRVAGCTFRVAAMTNLTQDHLDYHGDMQRYADAKAILFEQLIDRTRGIAVTFVDDDAGRMMRARATSASARLGVARAQAAGADVVVERSAIDARGTRATLATPVGRIEIETPLVGDYNVENLAIAVGMGIARGLPADAIVRGAADVAVPGRLQKVANARGVLCVVDYAHTPDGLERAVAAMRAVIASDEAGLRLAEPAAGGHGDPPRVPIKTARRLIVVFGCGGDRDRGKRPLMGEIAARGADLAIVTSDNPRTEDPGAIVDMIVEGVRRTTAPKLAAAELAQAARGYHVEVDRRAAIRVAAAAAAAGDVLLIAGKGHEDYQIVGTTKHHFDDREEAAAALAMA
jgi:UDP-N-acetylmuramoyl-L-alanyl-D-glutamate--2,6-diaminopimelate ligase